MKQRKVRMCLLTTKINHLFFNAKVYFLKNESDSSVDNEARLFHLLQNKLPETLFSFPPLEVKICTNY